jgi:hypothetical protein
MRARIGYLLCRLNFVIMKKTLLFIIVILAAGFRNPGTQDLTSAERKFAINYLNHTRSRLLNDVKGLSAAQLNFIPSDSGWSVAQCVAAAIQAFVARRDSTITYLTSTGDDLKTHFIEHPQWGTLDLYQGFIMLSAHCARHTLQLEEVMANPNFPKQ